MVCALYHATERRKETGAGLGDNGEDSTPGKLGSGAPVR